MNSGRIFSTVIYAIVAWLMGSTLVLGQVAPLADRLPPDCGAEPQSLSSETRTDRPPDAGCCESGCLLSCYRSRWTAAADFIILDRVGGFNQTLVELVRHQDDPYKTTGPEALNATDLHQGFAAGAQIDLIHHGDDGCDFEVLYFQIDGWSSARSVGPVIGPDGHPDWLVMRAPGTFVQLQNAPMQTMVWDYDSRLYNAEVNVRRTLWPRVTVLAGLRWDNLSEDFVGVLTPPTAHGKGFFWNTQTKNNLYGLQIGADARLWERDRFSIDGVLKTGIFDNRVDELTTVRMERIQFPESASTNHLAFLGQLGVQCKYQVTRQLSLKAGYEAIWLQGVALAPGQIPATYCHYDKSPQKTYVEALGVNCASGVFYHGATAGLEYSF
jgi:hypothetical protein